MIKIKCMRLPESCLRCPLSIINHYGERECFVTEEDVSVFVYERPEECPMEETDE